MKFDDERIQTTLNRFAAMGFFIWYLLLTISLLYRTVILKQHPRDWWDISAIWVIGILFVFIAYASKGVWAHGFKRFWLPMCIFLIICFFTSKFIAGEIHSVVDVGTSLVGFLAGLGLVIGIAYLLNRRWKRKAGIEEEE
jgi:hypothetical protein